jgi:hypothetical protein
MIDIVVLCDMMRVIKMVMFVVVEKGWLLGIIGE